MAGESALAPMCERGAVAFELEPSTPVNPCPDGWHGRASDALQQFRAGMHDRINRHAPGFGAGRKWASGWQRETMQAAARLNTPRLIIDWLPDHLRGRFAYRMRGVDA